jgi:hypothetical protein
MLNQAWNNAFFVENLLDIGLHTLSLMNSTYPSTIWEKYSASYARKEFCVCTSLQEVSYNNFVVSDKTLPSHDSSL